MIRTTFGATGLIAFLSACSGTPGPAPPVPFVGTGASTVRHTLATNVSRPATPAAAFVDSVGVNVHMSYYGTAYDPKNFSTLRSLLQSSGIKHLRDGMVPGQPTPIAEEQQLAASGIRFDYLMTPGSSTAQVNAWLSSVGTGVAEACEGDNEYDISHPSSDGNWPATDRTDQASLYGACHAAGLRVFAPAMATGASGYNALGNVGGNADAATMHDYFSWRNPGTPGWGANGYGSLAYNENAASAEAPGAPFVSTETGYGADAAQTNTYEPEAIRARYLVRTMLEAFASGIAHTYAYEFADVLSGGPYNRMGLVSDTLQPRASYNALSGTLGLLTDTGGSFTPGSLSYSLGGNDAQLHTLLLQKSDGSYWLALWKEAQEYDGDHGTVTTAAAENVTVTFDRPASSLTAYALDDSGAYQRSTLVPGGTVQLAVDGHPTLLRIALASPASLRLFGTANNAGGAGYSVGLSGAPQNGDYLFAGLATSAWGQKSSSIPGWSGVDGASNAQGIQSATYGSNVGAGGGTTVAVTENGGDWAGGIVLDVAGIDTTAPIVSDTWATTTSGQITCPAASAAAPAGGVVACLVYVNGGTQNASVDQTPTAPPGWSLLGSTGAAFNEAFAFARTAATAAGETPAGMQFYLDTNRNANYLTGTQAETVVFKPAS